MTNAEFQPIASTLPTQPGIYKYFNKNGELIYVGKAKNLRKRVSSYFNKASHSYKTQELVKNINHIEFTIVNTEQDALFLENSLIKQNQPKYNIDLKDDKTYPFIVIKKEPFPRIFLTRRKINDGSEYLGPFTSVGRVRELLEFIRNNIPLRTCKLALTENNINKGKFKVCLEYHLGNCKGPCEGLETRADYDASLLQIRNMLKGNLQPVVQHFKQEMLDLASKMEFEKAEQLKKKIEHLENYSARSVIVSNRFLDTDVFSLLRDGNMAYVNYLAVQNGTIVHTHTIPLEPRLDESNEEILLFAIAHLRTTFQSNSREIILPFEIDYPDPQVTITLPKGGDKLKLLELSQKNVDYYLDEVKKKKMLQLEKKTDLEINKVLEGLQKDLGLAELPTHIECFDNSNFQGAFPVSAMVCFKNGIPSKKDYRHFNVKTVEGINDFATMQEVVLRRYKRLKEENQPFPQLVIIDGGKGQLGAAMESIHELGLTGRMMILGLAKNEEELFYPGDSESLKLGYNSASLKLIRRIRDEVHRFGITFHRNQRSKGTFKNELEGIKGIGSQTVEELMKTFKSVRRVREAGLEEVAQLIGMAKAKLVQDHFKSKTEVA